MLLSVSAFSSNSRSSTLDVLRKIGLLYSATGIWSPNIDRFSSRQIHSVLDVLLIVEGVWSWKIELHLWDRQAASARKNLVKQYSGVAGGALAAGVMNDFFFFFFPTLSSLHKKDPAASPTHRAQLKHKWASQQPKYVLWLLFYTC